MLQLIFCLWCIPIVLKLLRSAGINVSQVLHATDERPPAPSSVDYALETGMIAGALTWYFFAMLLVFVSLFWDNNSELHRAKAPPVVIQFFIFLPPLLLLLLPLPLPLFRDRMHFFRIAGEVGDFFKEKKRKERKEENGGKSENIEENEHEDCWYKASGNRRDSRCFLRGGGGLKKKNGVCRCFSFFESFSFLFSFLLVSLPSGSHLISSGCSCSLAFDTS